MFTELETLLTLARHKTMGKTATALRVTQSTVSKRIQVLEYETGQDLIVKNGRYVELTEAGEDLIDRAASHVSALKEILYQEKHESNRILKLGFSESILSSWGAEILGHYAIKNKMVSIEPHAHRSPVIIEKIAASDLHFAIIAGLSENRPGLYFEEIGLEEMVIVGNKKGRLFCSEVGSGTWRAIEQDVYAAGIEVVERSEFFFPICHLASKGFCQGLVPKGVAISVGFSKREMKRTGVYRPIYGVGRKRAFLRAEVDELLKHFQKSIKKL